jgi:hypothetical protein
MDSCSAMARRAESASWLIVAFTAGAALFEVRLPFYYPILMFLGLIGGSRPQSLQGVQEPDNVRQVLMNNQVSSGLPRSAGGQEVAGSSPVAPIFGGD